MRRKLLLKQHTAYRGTTTLHNSRKDLNDTQACIALVTACTTPEIAVFPAEIEQRKPRDTKTDTGPVLVQPGLSRPALIKPHTAFQICIFPHLIHQCACREAQEAGTLAG